MRVNEFTDKLRDRLPAYGYDPGAHGPERLEMLARYLEMLTRWNTRIRLVGETDVETLVCRHLGESLYLGNFIDLGSKTLLDVGSGAGFPGLALALAWPDISTTLVESNSRKVAFLKAVIREFDLKATVLRARVEDSTIGGMDIVTCRALEEMNTAPKRLRRLVGDHGLAAYWVTVSMASTWQSVAGYRWFPPHPIPNSRERVIVTAEPA